MSSTGSITTEVGVMGWLQSIEGSSFSIWLKESPSIWGYPAILFLHTVGLSFSVGPSVAIDLRLLGFGRRLPISPFDAFFKVIWMGFWINAVSGAVLFLTDATSKLANPLFYVKMAFVFIAVGLMIVIRRRVFREPAIDGRPVAPLGRWLAAASIVSWFAAITAGRFMSYVGGG
jgi:hypothetical protein